jgi:hypothetical protein
MLLRKAAETSGCGDLCVFFVTATQQENFVNFAQAKRDVLMLRRTHLTSIVAPMAGEWEQSKYA